jgi:hypothetical protein
MSRRSRAKVRFVDANRPIVKNEALLALGTANRNMASKTRMWVAARGHMFTVRALTMRTPSLSRSGLHPQEGQRTTGKHPPKPRQHLPPRHPFRYRFRQFVKSVFHRFLLSGSRVPPPEGSRGHRHPILTRMLRPIVDRTLTSRRFTETVMAGLQGAGRGRCAGAREAVAPPAGRGGEPPGGAPGRPAMRPCRQQTPPTLPAFGVELKLHSGDSLPRSPAPVSAVGAHQGKPITVR